MLKFLGQPRKNAKGDANAVALTLPIKRKQSTRDSRIPGTAPPPKKPRLASTAVDTSTWQDSLLAGSDTGVEDSVPHLSATSTAATMSLTNIDGGVLIAAANTATATTPLTGDTATNNSAIDAHTFSNNRPALVISTKGLCPFKSRLGRVYKKRQVWLGDNGNATSSAGEEQTATPSSNDMEQTIVQNASDVVQPAALSTNSIQPAASSTGGITEDGLTDHTGTGVDQGTDPRTDGVAKDGVTEDGLTRQTNTSSDVQHTVLSSDGIKEAGLAKQALTGAANVKRPTSQGTSAADSVFAISQQVAWPGAQPALGIGASALTLSLGYYSTGSFAPPTNTPSTCQLSGDTEQWVNTMGYAAGGQVDLAEISSMEVNAIDMEADTEGIMYSSADSNGRLNMDTGPDSNGRINTGTSADSGTSFGSATGSTNPVPYIVQAARRDWDHGTNSSAGSSSGAYPDVAGSFSWTHGDNPVEYMDLEADFYTPTAASSGYGSNLSAGFVQVPAPPQRLAATILSTGQQH
ncbi:hypothetical protein GGH94_000395 [Coemansia aciculifera]|uniref:Uncharacterized protein n=1 Tax=Coemansia aciculifera TaxID=417176 RepID=A0A9W8M5Y3_9FUNG|nr:hypothetical protein GGH94_000395 [Coemansia aciculifera]